MIYSVDPENKFVFDDSVFLPPSGVLSFDCTRKVKYCHAVFSRLINFVGEDEFIEALKGVIKVSIPSWDFNSVLFSDLPQ